MPQVVLRAVCIYILANQIFFDVVNSYDDADLTIDAEQVSSRFGGTDKNAVGDFNHDGWPDLAVGAYRYNPGGKANAGKSYVFLGGEHAWDTDLNAGTDADFTATGTLANYYAGDSSASGDVNNDGIDDLVIQSLRGDLSSSGELAVFFGSETLAGNKLITDADFIIEKISPQLAAVGVVSTGTVLRSKNGGAH